MAEITAAVVRRPGGPFELATVTLAPLRASEVRVRLVATGICHADLLARDQVASVPLPAVLGHEGAGVVEEVGSGVTRVAVGDHVVLGFASCDRCRMCAAGYPGNCVQTNALNFGGRRLDGSTPLADASGPITGSFFGQSSFATHANVGEHQAVRVPSHLPLDVLAPLGCGVMTGVGTVLNVLKPGPGSSIAILGAGAVGLAALLGAVLSRCTTIIAVDVVPARLDRATELGATSVVDARSVDPVAAVLDATGGDGVEFAIDAAGDPTVFRQMLDCLGIRGHGALVGAPAPGREVALDLNPSLGAGRRVSFVLEGDAHPQLFIPRLVGLIEAGLLPVERLITRYPFTAVNNAVAGMLSGDAVKPVLRF